MRRGLHQCKSCVMGSKEAISDIRSGGGAASEDGCSPQDYLHLALTYQCFLLGSQGENTYFSSNLRSRSWRVPLSLVVSGWYLRLTRRTKRASMMSEDRGRAVQVKEEMRKKDSSSSMLEDDHFNKMTSRMKRYMRFIVSVSQEFSQTSFLC